MWLARAAAAPPRPGSGTAAKAAALPRGVPPPLDPTGRDTARGAAEAAPHPADAEGPRGREGGNGRRCSPSGLCRRRPDTYGTAELPCPPRAPAALPLQITLPGGHRGSGPGAAAVRGTVTTLPRTADPGSLAVPSGTERPGFQTGNGMATRRTSSLPVNLCISGLSAPHSTGVPACRLPGTGSRGGEAAAAPPLGGTEPGRLVACPAAERMTERTVSWGRCVGLREWGKVMGRKL
ncbi:sterile alpha motif domain-containing protein 1-like isoform X2 [Pseudopipra pipra]|uniref:sterile alpha motif domain-containing protein 1-like isoform X2 n=1 Tax=Pseudopipra pipra TaxID=415032 RepID=UPI00313A4535